MENDKIGPHERQSLLQVAGLVVNVRGAEGRELQLLQMGDPFFSAGVVGRKIMLPVAANKTQ